MIAVVYSGSRYADWKLSDKGEIVSDFQTTGINPFFSDEKDITQLLNKTNELINHAEQIKKIYFFAAGAFSKSRQLTVEEALSKFFRYGKVSVEHDIKAAAIATCQDQPGIVGILGSGSNAAYYNGKKIKENNFGLGCILGDEGSATWLGRHLLRDLLTDSLPKKIENSFYNKYTLDKKQILDKVYKQPYPAFFLSSFAEFLIDQQKEDYVKKLVISGFEAFFETYVLCLSKQYPDVPLHLTGTIADGFEFWLKEVAGNYGLTIASIIKEPIDNVLNYYSTKN